MIKRQEKERNFGKKKNERTQPCYISSFIKNQKHILTVQGYKLHYLLICAQLFPEPAGSFIHRVVKQESKFFEQFYTEYNKLFGVSMVLYTLHGIWQFSNSAATGSSITAYIVMVWRVFLTYLSLSWLLLIPVSSLGSAVGPHRGSLASARILI